MLDRSNLLRRPSKKPKKFEFCMKIKTYMSITLKICYNSLLYVMFRTLFPWQSPAIRRKKQSSTKPKGHLGKKFSEKKTFTKKDIPKACFPWPDKKYLRLARWSSSGSGNVHGMPVSFNIMELQGLVRHVTSWDFRGAGGAGTILLYTAKETANSRDNPKTVQKIPPADSASSCMYSTVGPVSS